LERGIAYLDEARGRASLKVVGDALAERVELDRGRAVAAVVHPRGERLRLEAGRFVISAGMYGSPAILLRIRTPLGSAQAARRAN
jgi:choline dehydrogenase